MWAMWATSSRYCHLHLSIVVPEYAFSFTFLRISVSSHVAPVPCPSDALLRYILPQQSAKNTEDNDCGTMLQIKSVQMLSDGRSMVETFGTFRFRILERGTLDGYLMGRIARIDDYSPKIEAGIERNAMANPTDSDLSMRVVERSNRDLLNACWQFVNQLRHDTAPWVVQHLNNTYGPMPSDISSFSSVHPDSRPRAKPALAPCPTRPATGYQRELEDQFLKRLCLDGEEVEPGYAPSDLGQDDEDDADAEYEYEDEHEHKLHYPPYQHQHQGYHASVHPAARVQPTIPSQAHECAMPMPVVSSSSHTLDTKLEILQDPVENTIITAANSANNLSWKPGPVRSCLLCGPLVLLRLDSVPFLSALLIRQHISAAIVFK
ncbi:hypothetical protein FRC09_010219 [Ceratobasidium sp. 395]|nr:hypothetical protein FRC09_010219 [Ceratobasidium sp. 395]